MTNNYRHKAERVSKKDMEYVNKLSTATRTHFTHFLVPKLPWHDDNHKFGESSDGGVEGTKITLKEVEDSETLRVLRKEVEAAKEEVLRQAMLKTFSTGGSSEGEVRIQGGIREEQGRN
jgi:hypothetical protein